MLHARHIERVHRTLEIDAKNIHRNLFYNRYHMNIT